jgi:enamine deaminase RidA (YjgF/YER057c/UK114 family)
MPIDERLTDVPGVSPGPGYAHGVTVSGRLAFISGQVALDEDGQLVSSLQVIRDVRDELIGPGS